VGAAILHNYQIVIAHALTYRGNADIAISFSYRPYDVAIQERRQTDVVVSFNE